jgi:type I restriction-modification system DNA methylase subunit
VPRGAPLTTAGTLASVPSGTVTPTDLRAVSAEVAARRLLGAYYTPDDVARVITRWALNGSKGPVLDPSCGGGAFMRAAVRELRALGDAAPADKTYGVDVDPECLAAIREGGEVAAERCVVEDFLALSPEALDGAPFHAIVGNPPYVRHHWLKGDARAAAYAARDAHAEPVKLAGTASLWAYFVVHSLGFLSPGGRLAMLVPEAILQSDPCARAPVQRHG